MSDAICKMEADLNCSSAMPINTLENQKCLRKGVKKVL
jgi:hypothetical protein